MWIPPGRLFLHLWIFVPLTRVKNPGGAIRDMPFFQDGELGALELPTPDVAEDKPDDLPAPLRHEAADRVPGHVIDDAGVPLRFVGGSGDLAVDPHDRLCVANRHPFPTINEMGGGSPPVSREMRPGHAFPKQITGGRRSGLGSVRAPISADASSNCLPMT